MSETVELIIYGICGGIIAAVIVTTVRQIYRILHNNKIKNESEMDFDEVLDEFIKHFPKIEYLTYGKTNLKHSILMPEDAEIMMIAKGMKTRSQVQIPIVRDVEFPDSDIWKLEESIDKIVNYNRILLQNMSNKKLRKVCKKLKLRIRVVANSNREEVIEEILK